MNNTKFLNKNVTLKITQPLGSKHPVHNMYYPLNCGYLVSGSKKLGAYILGVYEPLEIFEGRCIAILHKKAGDKLVVVPSGKYYTDSQIRALTEFAEFQESVSNYCQIIRN